MLCSLAQPCPALPVTATSFPHGHICLCSCQGLNFPWRRPHAGVCRALHAQSLVQAAHCSFSPLLFKLQCKYLHSARLLLRAQSTSLKLEAALVGIETKPVGQSLLFRSSQGMGRTQK